MSAALQGYLLGVGKLGQDMTGLIIRVLVGAAGMSLAIPAGGMFGLSQWLLLAIAVVLLTLGLGLRKVRDTAVPA